MPECHEAKFPGKSDEQSGSSDLHQLLEGLQDIKFVITLLMMLEIKDESTYRHSLNVGRMACSMGEALALPEQDCQTLRLAGILHDVGKLFIDKAILCKEEPLTRQEYAEISRHPSLGANILSFYPEFHQIAQVIRWHHERYDGRGYPGRYQGEQIPYFSRILAVCDVWVALVSVRPYRPAFSPDKARDVILKEAGRQLDPELAAFFVKKFVTFGFEHP